MIKKVVYISYLPLTQKVFGDYFMSQIQQAGIDVEYLDVSELFHDVSTLEHFDSPIVCKLTSYSELRNYLKKQEIDSTLFISMITYEWRCLRLYRQLTRHKCLLGRFANNNNVVPVPAQTSKRRRFLTRLSRITPKKLKNYMGCILAKFAKQYGYIKPHNIVFNGGFMGHLTIGIGSNIDMDRAKIVQINSTDYNTYQNSIDQPRLIEEKYALFLDEYLPLHPDFALFGIKTINYEQYYKEINTFFDQVEKQYNLQVVIAAHPKALRYKEENFFNGRQVVFGQTASLAKNAEFILAHGSTSCGFAAMYKKPLTILTSQAIADTMPKYNTEYQFFATTFGSKCIKYDEPLGVDIISEINSAKYDTYKYNFLTSPESKNRRSVDIFIETLKKYPN